MTDCLKSRMKNILWTVTRFALGTARLGPAVLVTFLLAGCGPSTSSVGSNQALLHLDIGYPSAVDVEDIPSLMAHELLVEQGYTVTPTFYSQAELAVAALARGDADFSVGAGRTIWQAISQGAELIPIMEHAANGWLALSVPEIATCRDLDGRRYAHHSEGGVSKAMSDAYILEKCPGTQPEILIIPGSANRAAALLAGQIEVAMVKVADRVEIEAQAPGRYHAVMDFAHDLPMLKTTGVYVNQEFAAQQPEAVKDYIKAVLTIHRQIADDPNVLIPEVNKWLPIDAEILPQVLEAQLAVNTWDVNGGMDEESIQFSLDFFTRAGSLEPGLTVERISDLSYLNEVLNAIGRQ